LHQVEDSKWVSTNSKKLSLCKKQDIKIVISCICPCYQQIIYGGPNFHTSVPIVGSTVIHIGGASFWFSFFPFQQAVHILMCWQMCEF
jgi:hypothetical protein